MDNSKIGKSKTQLRALISNRDLKFFEIQFFKVEGRSLEFPMEKLELVLTQYVGVFDHNFIGEKMEFLLRCRFEISKNPNDSNIQGFHYISKFAAFLHFHHFTNC
jgi:hypothetical protein